MSVSGYIHTLNRLPHTDNGGDMCIIASMKANSNIAYRAGGIVFGSKTGPYSEQDAMLIYSGYKRDCTRFDTLPPSVQRVFLTSAMRVAEYLCGRYEEEINNQGLFPLIGMNTAINPDKGQVQSIGNPHFHASLLPITNETNQTNRTEVIPVIDSTNEDHQRAFCIRDNNYIFRDLFLSGKSQWTRSVLYSMDYPLPGTQLSSERHKRIFENIYSEAWSYIDGIDIKGERGNRGFSIGFVYKQGRWVIRLAFFEKADIRDSGGSAEMSGHAIRRVEVYNASDIADTREFARSVATCLNNHRR